MPFKRLPASLDRAIDRFSDWSLKRLLAIDGYHVAALFLFLLWIGARLDPHNGIFIAIEQRVPLFTPLWWEVTFLLCAGIMANVPRGRFEDAVALVFFIFPVTLFFGFLVALTVGNQARPTPYFLLLLIVACVLVIDTFVVRTRALNYCKLRIVELELLLAQERARSPTEMADKSKPGQAEEGAAGHAT